MKKVLIAVGAIAATVLAVAQVGLAAWAGTSLGEVALAWSETPVSSTMPDPEDETWEYFDEETTFAVGADASLSPTPDAEAAAAWDLFRRVAGEDIIVDHVESFIVGDEEDSDFSAYVRPEGDDSWALVVNLAYDHPYDLATTMVHEYAHLLSLNATQVDHDVDWSRCGQTWVFEGCPREDAVIARFQDRFWDMYGYDVPDGIAGAADVAEFWSGREEQFVSEYAATSVLEDFAETFTTWVLLDGAPARSWGFRGLAEEKLEFLDDEPSIQGERERILAAIESELYG
ncbi:MAG: NADH:ubiquinone oxidoreductase subunit 4 (chain M) [Microbacterium sp.]